MRITAFLLAVAGFLLTPVAGQAQITLPVFDPDKNPGQTGPSMKGLVFEEAAKARDFRPGSVLRITLNDESETKLVGTLVRIDRPTTRIFLRTQAGALPRAIAQKDIKKAEKATRSVRDPIRSIVFQEDVVVPEIRQMIVYNGAVRTVHYAGKVLSVEERKSLQELEDAENEFARLDALHGQRSSVVDTELAIQSERLTSHHLINRLLWQQAQSGFWVEWPSRSFHVLQVWHDQPELAKVIGLLPSGESWGKARDNVRAQRDRAVFEDGRLVAVVVEEK